MAAAETTDTINCSFKLREFWVPAAISASCGAAAVALGFYFLWSGGFRLDAWVYSAVNLACSVPFFMITMGYVHILSGEYRMEIFQDGINADRHAQDYKHMIITVRPKEKMEIHLAPGGGFAARLTPVK